MSEEEKEEEIKEENLRGNSLLEKIVEVEGHNVKPMKRNVDYGLYALDQLNAILWRIARKYIKITNDNVLNYENIRLLDREIKGLIIKRFGELAEKHPNNCGEFDIFGNFIQESLNTEEWLDQEIDFFNTVIKKYKDWELAEYINDLMVLSRIMISLSYLGAVYQKEEKGEEK
jgi:hypothetical protein